MGIHYFQNSFLYSVLLIGSVGLYQKIIYNNPLNHMRLGSFCNLFNHMLSFISCPDGKLVSHPAQQIIFRELLLST